jgi:hypothetical protein
VAKQVNQQDQPIRSTNHVYGSGQKSAIQRTIADSKLKRPDQLQANITPPAVAPKGQGNDPSVLQSSDKYYANQENKVAKPAPFVMDQADTVVQNSGVMTQPVAHNQSTHLVEIKTEGELASKMQETVQALQQGVGTVRVLLYNKDWAAKARQQIEFAVTREIITEDQGRDVQYGVHRSQMADNVIDETVTAEAEPTDAEAALTPQAAADPADIMAGKAEEVGGHEVASDTDDTEDVESLLGELEASNSDEGAPAPGQPVGPTGLDEPTGPGQATLESEEAPADEQHDDYHADDDTDDFDEEDDEEFDEDEDDS